MRKLNFSKSFSILFGLFVLFLFINVNLAKADTTTGLVGWWKMDDGSGTFAGDSSGNGFSANFAPPPGEPVWTSGNFNGGLNFDGVDDYINAGDIGNVNTAEMSVAFWVNFAVLPGGWAAVVSKGINGGTDGFQYVIGSNGAGGNIAINTSDPADQYNGRCTIDLTGMENQFKHFAFVWSSDQGWCKGYVNGAEVVAENTSILMNPSQTFPLEIGRGYADSSFYSVNAIVDDVRIYNRALSPADILELQSNVSCDQVGTNAFFGCYYTSATAGAFTTLNTTRTDNTINFNWGVGSPDASVPIDLFAVKWQGDFSFSAGNYDFTATTDDGMRFYIDDVLQNFDQPGSWSDQAPATYTKTVAMTAGTHKITVEYYENDGGAVAQFSWAAQGGSPPSSGLVGWWKMDESGNTFTAVDSAGTNNGALTNFPADPSASWLAGQIGGALSFDGVNNYVNVPFPSVFNDIPSTPFTVSFWTNTANIPGQGTYKRLLEATTNDKNKWEFSGASTANVIQFRMAVDVNGARTDFKKKASLPINQWVMVTGVWDTSTLKLYVNSTESTTAGEGSIGNGTVGQFNIGRRSDGSAASYYNGLIDDVRIYNYALNQIEINTLYSNSSSGPVGWWKMDETSGTTAADSSGYNNSGALMNGPFWVPGQPPLNGSLGLDGIDDYVNAGAGNSLDITGSLTISAWVNPSSFPDGSLPRIVDKRQSSGLGYVFFLDEVNQSSGRLRFISDNDTSPTASSAGDVLPNAGPQMVTVTYDSSTNQLYFYKNAQNVGSAIVAPPTSNSNNLSIGNRETNDRQLNGTIDDLRIYNRALTPAEISTLYNDGLPPPSPPEPCAAHNVSNWAWSETIGWISFNCNNQGTGTDYGIDVGADGTISGFAWSENIGWISFNAADVAGCQTAPCAPTLNKTTGVVDGWAKALAADGIGWDGWIHLKGTSADSSPYGVTVSNCNWDGWAWGGEVVGWIHFKGTNYGILGANGSDACGGTPSADIKADAGAGPSDGPVSISSGSSATISWTSIGAAACYVANTAWSGITGSQSTGPLTTSTIYNLICSTSSGPTDTIGWWKFDEGTGTTASDSSGNGNIGTLSNGPTWTSGQIDNALYFDGVDDIVDAGSGPLLDNLPALSASAWIYSENTSAGTKILLSKETCEFGCPSWKFGQSDFGSGRLSFRVNYSGTRLYRGSIDDVIPLNTWTHVLVTWDGSQYYSNVHFYVNGTEVDYDSNVSTDATGIRLDDSSANFSIGARAFDFGDAWNGKIEDIRLFNRELSQTEIANIYHEGLSTFADSVTLNVSSSCGAYNLDFDGSDDIISVDPGAPIDDLAQMSLAAWIKPTAISPGSGGSYVMRKRDPASSLNSWGLVLVDNAVCNISSPVLNNAFYFVKITNDTDGSGNVITAVEKCSQSNSIQLDTWQHIAATWDGSRSGSGVHLYVNGSEITDSFNVGHDNPILSDASFPLYLGNSPSFNRAFKGQMKDVQIYDRVLSPAEVASIYANSMFSGLIGRWYLNEGSGTTANDSSGSGKNGNLQNGPQWVTTIDPGEDCDGSNLGGETCVSQGALGGTLSCTSSCTFDVTQCTFPPPAVCEDGIDNDGDLQTDYPNDVGCSSAKDHNEENQCVDGIDNDGDMLIDAADPGCYTDGNPDNAPSFIPQGNQESNQIFREL